MLGATFMKTSYIVTWSKWRGRELVLVGVRGRDIGWV